MSAATKRTIIRFVSLFIAAGAGDAIVQWATMGFYDWRHLAGGLVVAAVLGFEKWASEQSNSIASPTVVAVTTALQNQAASVPPPTVAIKDPPVAYTPPSPH